MNLTPFSITVRGRLVTFDRPAVMGILNITPDSFYDGGRYTNGEAMLHRAHQLIDEGADIIDLGAASSRPGAELPPPEVEAARLKEAITLIRKELPQTIISVDTCWSLPARTAIEAGADIINDISGGQFERDQSGANDTLGDVHQSGANDTLGVVPKMFQTVADLQVPYILMHNRALPDEMQQHTGYDDIVDDLTKYFSQRLDTLYRLGVKDVWIDPGFGFAKTTEENHELLHRLDELTSLFHKPLLTALSRKSMIYKPLGITPDEALAGTVALDTVALMKGSRILRVHDPRPARQTIQLLFKK